MELQLVFQKYRVICNVSKEAFSSVYLKNIDFLKNGRLNLHKNACNQRKVQSCKENRYYSLDLEPIFQKFLVICNDCNYAFNSVYEKH